MKNIEYNIGIKTAIKVYLSANKYNLTFSQLLSQNVIIKIYKNIFFLVAYYSYET